MVARARDPNRVGRVVLVAVEQDARATLTEALRGRGFAVLDTPDRGVALKTAADADLVLLDLDELGDARSAVTALYEAGVSVVVVASSAPAAQRVALLEAGADDYVTKPVPPDELAARLRAVLRRSRRTGWGRSIVHAGALEMDFTARVARVKGRRIPLTPTEWRLLEELAAHPGTVLGHSHLSSAVWGMSQSTDTRSLRVHISNLRRKLTGAGIPLIDTDHGLGYRWRGPPPGPGR